MRFREPQATAGQPFVGVDAVISIRYENVHLVQPFHKTLIIFLAAFNHPSQWVGEPLLELTVGLEDMWHEKVHKRPQLHQTVLQRSTSKQQSPVTLCATKTKTGGIMPEQYYFCMK